MSSFSVRFNSKLMRLLPLLVCIPYVLLSPLTGQAIHLHDHDAQGLHAHVQADFIHESEDSDWAAIHYDAHRHSDGKSIGVQEHFEFVIDLTTDVVFRVLPAIVASPPCGIRTAQHCLAPAFSATVSASPAVPIKRIPSPDFFDLAPGTRAYDALALILRANNAILI